MSSKKHNKIEVKETLFIKDAFNKNIETISKELNTDLKNGLSTSNSKETLTKYGLNELEVAKPKHLFLRFLEQFKDFMIIILLLAAAFAITMAFVHNKPEELVEGFLIIAIVLINAIVGITQEAKAEKSLDAIKKMSSPHTKVIRDGIQLEIDVADVVVGDIVVLDAGDYVPADLRIIEAINLKIDESALTGEAVPVEKEVKTFNETEVPLGDRINCAYMSTVVTYGRGKAIVVATGMNTEIGKIATMLNQTETDLTPLQKDVAKLGKTLAILALIVVGLIFAIVITKSLIQEGEITLDAFTNAIMTSVSLAVAAIPEGLPAMVTIILAIGMQNLASQKAIMRTLPAVETLGSTSVICSDKTGTLTQNVMTVEKVFINNKLHSISTLEAIKTNNDINKFITYGVLCNDTKVRIQDNKFLKIGDPTEIAFVDLAINIHDNPITMFEKYPRIFELPFDSTRKLMTTVHDFENGRYAVIKGAPDVIFSKSVAATLNNQIIETNDFTSFINANNEMSSNALRVLAIAIKKLDHSISIDQLSHLDNIEDDLTLVGLVGMIDPARPEAKDAIILCKEAGITTVMITGDHKNTAVAIAKQLGLYNESENIAITGAELDKMSDEEFSKVIHNIRVYARVSPENKVRIVSAWRATGVIVAMTGDGVNDAPSIKQADIGIAMGITGTEVSKGAADMILTDDNFATIVNSVSEGRSIFANIKKVIQFLLSCNIGEILTVFLGITLGMLLFTDGNGGSISQVLTSTQLLWVNLVTDSFMAIALGMEPKEPDIMRHPPRDAKKSIFSGGLGKTIILQGIMIGLLTFGAYTIGFYMHPTASFLARQAEGQTLAFMTLAMSQLTHAFNIRSNTFSIFSLKQNKKLYIAAFLGLALQLCVVLIPFIRDNIFGLVEMDYREWLIVFGLSLLPIVFCEIGKIFVRKKQFKAPIA